MQDPEDDCKGCIKEGSILSIGLKKKVEEIEKETTKSFADKGERTSARLFCSSIRNLAFPMVLLMRSLNLNRIILAGNVKG